MFEGKTVLITGGTGSLGTALTKRLLENNVKQIRIFSRNELKQIEMESKFHDDRLRFLVGDIRELPRLIRATEDVDYVFHAAALKHVPKIEYNPFEAIKTNVSGSQNVIDASINNNVEKVVALSTDKAANPINLYGATKLSSDKLFIAANNLSGGKQIKFSVVRYGNVFGSRGSVVPLFLNFKKAGTKKYPITDKRMTRFWITLDQAVNFVLDSFERMQGGEVFVPKIPSVNILDVLKAIDSSSDYEEVGIRPGEKLHEVMCPSDESHRVLEFEKYYSISPSIQFFSESINYSKSLSGELGNKVPDNFDYDSLNNPWYLTVDEIKDYIKNYL